MASNSNTLLVTTARENTWGEAEKILFLGEWCKLYDRRHIWMQRDHNTMPFHWDDRTKFDRDYDSLKTLHHRLLNSLAVSLNRFHNVNHSTRYWQVLLDPWLMSYVGVVFDRWEAVRQAFEEHETLQLVSLEQTNRIPPFSYLEFVEQTFSDDWNALFFQEIIKAEYHDRCDIRVEVAIDAIDFPSKVPTKKKNLLKTLASVVDQFLGLFQTSFDVVFVESSFNPVSLIKLNLALRQVPRLFTTEFETDKVDARLPSIRSSIEFNFLATSAFEVFVKKSLLRDMPSCLLENYSRLKEAANRVPIQTKVIVTANSHWYDVKTKAWMAEQISKGVKLVILEHGGSFPAKKELFDFEEDIADAKGTWFLPYHPKHVQVPPAKLVSAFKKKALTLVKKSSSRRYCSIIGNECTRYILRAHYYPMSHQCLVSINLNAELYKGLSEEIKPLFRVKPYPDQGWSTGKRYADTLGVECILSEKKIDQVFKLSKLIVCTYPETTFSEAMVSGVPTVLLYPDYLYERHPLTSPLLELLRSANIIFHDPVAASAHINAIWADPNRWWSSPTVIHARDEFRRQAVNADRNWLSVWTTFVKEVVARA